MDYGSMKDICLFVSMDLSKLLESSPFWVG